MSQNFVYNVVVVQKITRKILQRQFLEYKMTRSLSNKLLGSETQETDLYTNNHGCESIPEYVRVIFGSQNINMSQKLVYNKCYIEQLYILQDILNIDNILQYNYGMLTLQRVHELQDRLVVVCTQTMQKLY